MKNSVQEGKYTKIGALLGAVAIISAYFFWRFPYLTQEPVGEVIMTEIHGEAEPPPPRPYPTPPLGTTTVLETPQRSCRPPKPLPLSEGSPVKVASSLATLAVAPGRIGTETFLTLGISSDREARSEVVLGAPQHYRFQTSLGNYFVNVTELDLATNTMIVEVGCE